MRLSISMTLNSVIVGKFASLKLPKNVDVITQSDKEQTNRGEWLSPFAVIVSNQKQTLISKEQRSYQCAKLIECYNQKVQQQNMESKESIRQLTKQTSSTTITSCRDQQWSKENPPFQGGYEKFKNIKKEDRSKYNKAMIKTWQKSEQPPFIFQKEYAGSGRFEYEGYKLYYHCIEQTQSPKAVVIYCPETNGHGGSSGYFASVLTSYNPELNFYALDPMNFGQSQGPCRGQVFSLDDSINQLNTFLDHLMSKFKTKPKIFLSGCSYGGSIAFYAAVISPQKYSGLILLSPAIKDIAENFRLKKKVIGLLACFCARMKFHSSNRSDTKYNQIERVKNDKNNYLDGFLSLTAYNVYMCMLDAEDKYKNLSTPYIIFQGGIDKIVDPFGPLELEEKCKSKDKTTIYCEHMWHDVMNQDEIEGISWMVRQWLKERI